MFMTVLIFNKRLCLIFIHLNDFLYIQKPFLPGVFYEVVRKTSLAVTPAAAHPVYLPLIPLLTLLHVLSSTTLALSLGSCICDSSISLINS